MSDREDLNDLVKEPDGRLRLSRLSRLEINVFCAYLGGMPMKQIADRYGIKFRSVDNALQRAKNKVRPLW